MGSGLVSTDQLDEWITALDLSQQTVAALTKQVMRLGQCVECGELDEQDGVRKDGKFRCVGCLP